MAQDAELGGHVISGRYRLVRRVGDSVPLVYEARHPRLASRFQVKLWPPTTPWDAFRRGAEVAATLRHPGVVQVIDFNCEPGKPPFLVAEWVEGTRLSEVMASSGLLPVARVAALVESAAWALAAAHQQGVVHQELRPDEIYVVQAPGTTREWTKLDGFGVLAALTRVGAWPTAPYRAPEQAAPEDEEAADPQSDQFALAAIAYEMLSGVRPFETSGTAAPADGPPLLSDMAPDVSLAVDTVIRQGLATDPEERFAGVLEFARALRDAAQGASTQVVRRRKLEARARTRVNPTTVEAQVSPFFNPVQSPPSEGIRLSAPLGRLWALRRLVPRLPVNVFARIGLALAMLLLAFGAVAVLMRHPPARTATGPSGPRLGPATTAESEAAAAPAPAPATATATAPAASTGRIALQVEPIGKSVVDVLPIAPSPSPSSSPSPSPAPAATTAPPSPPPKRARPARPPASPAGARAPAAAAATAPAAASGGGEGACVMSVSSSPWAEIWLDDRNTGRRTPLAGYKVPCGDHKLVLKRNDLDIYQMEVITVRPGTTFKKSYPLR